MIDIHSHILPNVDDGPKNIEDSIKLLKQAYEAGITTIIATSHYMEEKYNVSKEQREEILSNLQKEINKKDINIKLCIGSEAYICPDLDELVRDGTIPTLNNSRYILFELPMNTKVVYLDNVINNLLTKKYIPVIAHPERYTYIQEDVNIIKPLLEKGVLFQANYGSISGIYGKQAKKTFKKLLKMNAIHFLASDVHRPDSIYTKTDKMLKKISRMIGKRRMDILTQENPNKVMRNENI